MKSLVKKTTSLMVGCLFMLLLSLFVGQVDANIIEVKDFRMQQMTLVNKYRFVFSDFGDDESLKHAKIKFDLSVQPVSTANHTMVLFIIEANEEAGEQLITTLKSLNSTQLIYADQLVKAIRPIKDQLTVCDQVLIDVPNNQTVAYFNKTFQIYSEGVYQTYFVYGALKDKEIPPMTKNGTIPDDWSIFDWNFVGGEGKEETVDTANVQDSDGDRILYDHNSSQRSLIVDKVQKQVHVDRPHLTINGKISFVNSYGFLNAEQYPLLTFYLFISVFYLIFTVVWIVRMRSYQDQIIQLHYYILFMFIVSLLQCVLLYIEYDIYNRTGTRSVAFIGFNVLFQAFKNSLGRLTVLLISLGYGIVMNRLNRYQVNIAVLTFLFFVSNAMYLACLYINQYVPVSPAVKLGVSLPQAIFDAIYLVWIWSALRRTLTYLKQKKQSYKYEILKKFAITLLTGTIVSVVLTLIWVFICMMGERDALWEIEWMFETCWLIILSVVLVVIAFVMRPGERSKMLVSIQELLDETLTEMDQTSNRNNDFNVDMGSPVGNRGDMNDQKLQSRQRQEQIDREKNEPVKMVEMQEFDYEEDQLDRDGNEI